MNKQYQPKHNLTQLADGAVQIEFDRAMEAVLQNMLDVNTPYKPKRSIVVKVDFEQNEQRNNLKVNVSVDKKVVSAVGIQTQMAVGKDLKSGQIMVEEYGKQIKGQMSLSDYQQEQAEQPQPEAADEQAEPDGKADGKVKPIRKVIGG